MAPNFSKKYFPESGVKLTSFCTWLWTLNSYYLSSFFFLFPFIELLFLDIVVLLFFVCFSCCFFFLYWNNSFNGSNDNNNTRILGLIKH